MGSSDTKITPEDCCFLRLSFDAADSSKIRSIYRDLSAADLDLHNENHVIKNLRHLVTSLLLLSRTSKMTHTFDVFLFANPLRFSVIVFLSHRAIV